jgi:hypothetical protein
MSGAMEHSTTLANPINLPSSTWHTNEEVACHVQGMKLRWSVLPTAIIIVSCHHHCERRESLLQVA